MVSGQKWAIYFLMAVGVWNFVGAGVFGFLINLPIVSYFEVGTTLTANHGTRRDVRGLRHAGPGSPGLLPARHAIRRRLEGDGEVHPRGASGALNAGLALMVILDLFPGGVLQLWDSIANGYWHARRLTFLMGGTFHKLEWLRMVGDMVFLFAGALPITLGALRSVWKRDLSPTA